jgi:hypothetical protein
MNRIDLYYYYMDENLRAMVQINLAFSQKNVNLLANRSSNILKQRVVPVGNTAEEK